jgi:hypothetical protein
MKVLNLQCAGLHLFEGWFSSEDDFAGQHIRREIHCPVCNNNDIVKRLSAPRLSLGATEAQANQPSDQEEGPVAESPVALQSQWLQVCKDILAATTDVGNDFTEAARKIHYGEAPHRAIRGQATQEQVQTLVEEGIGVLPLPVPEYLLGPRH